MLNLRNHGKILESFFSLSLLNAIKLILPLITIPYLIRTVGMANYGIYAIVYSMVIYILEISNYGFTYSATRQVAQNRDNKECINSIFSSVLVCRLLLAALSAVFLVFLSLIVWNRKYMIMVIFGLGIVIGDILNPVWLFQGMEKMRYMTIVNFVSKLLFTLLVFVFIKEQDHYIFIPLLDSFGYILAGLLSIWIAYKEFGVKFHFPKMNEIVFQFKDGLYIFMSTIFMNLYRNSNTFILGLFVSEAAVGMYAGAEKIIKALQSVSVPISGALFPHLAESFKDHPLRENINKLMRLVKPMTAFLLVVCIIAYFFAPLMNKLLLDGSITEPIDLIRIMLPVVLFGCLNYILGIVGLINLNKQNDFFRSVMISGLCGLLFLICTVHFWGNVSAALSMVLSEIMLTIMCSYYLIKVYGSNINS